MTNTNEKKIPDYDLNQKTELPGRNSDKVPQEGKDGDFSTAVNRSYKKGK